MSGKVLDQSVFDGAPDWVRFATVTSTGAVVHWEDEPFDAQGAWNVENLDSRYCVLAKHAYDYSNWQQSKIKRERPIIKDASELPDDVKKALDSFAIGMLHSQGKLIRFKKLRPDAKIPVRATDGAAGFDLHSTKRIEVPPGQRMLLPTGIACAIPDGWCGQVWPRSGLAVKHGINVLAGMIDSDYRGELHVSLINHGADTWEVKEGDRIAQLVFVQVLTTAVEVDDLDDTARGVGGFGSTGK
jgi:dUTP pyrophosphatase